MGSGDKFKYGKLNCFGLGIYIDRFPFALTVGINVLFWYVSVGFGKGYDEQ